MTDDDPENDSARVSDEETLNLLVHEEYLEPVVREERRRVEVRKTIRTEPAEVSVMAFTERATVRRHRVEREVDEVPEPYWKDNTYVIPVVEEELVVTRRLVVREEVHITRTSGTEQVTIPGTVRREVIDIDELDDADVLTDAPVGETSPTETDESSPAETAAGDDRVESEVALNGDVQSDISDHDAANSAQLNGIDHNGSSVDGVEQYHAALNGVELAGDHDVDDGGTEPGEVAAGDSGPGDVEPDEPGHLNGDTYAGDALEPRELAADAETEVGTVADDLAALPIPSSSDMVSPETFDDDLWSLRPDIDGIAAAHVERESSGGDHRVDERGGHFDEAVADDDPTPQRGRHRRPN